MINDFVKLSLSSIRRNKKNKSLIAICVLLLSLLIVDVVFLKSVYSYINYAIEKNIYFRTYSIHDDKGRNLDEIKEDLKNVKHISEIYQSKYNSEGGNIDIKEQKVSDLDGSVILYYGTNNIVPKSLVGKDMKDVKSGELICPYNFYPDSSIDEELDEGKFLAPDKILNKEFTFSYSMYEKNEDNGIKLKDTIGKKKFKIVGFYDNKLVLNMNNECYATPSDLIEIVDNSGISNYGENFFNIVVDKNKNTKRVAEELSSKGYLVDNLNGEIDNSEIFPIKLAGFIFFIVIFGGFLIIFTNYLRKKYNGSSKSIGILRACGYTKKQMIIKESIENILIVTISFIISMLPVVIIYFIVKYYCLKKIMYVYNIKFELGIIILLFILLVVITIRSTKKQSGKKCEIDEFLKEA